uniref:EF-hand domain-containing protein n=1 Tax=Spumella elongata TaxID=89044 RepID=A0A7S3M1J4_9STRA|mmetsp:Transcript_21475/g.37128  ORF Transcript_21475/g.37128 Transcript_21475/m.37128 type:complete len:466 (+) Transcript_21475:19-1416(+)
MGGGVSMSGVDDIRKDWVDVFKAMKLKNNEIKKLNKIFNSVDVDKSGSIEVVELLTLLDIERTPFNVRIFAAFDKDRTGQIDLYEFVVSLWKFCSLSDGAISVFAFDIYDTDADGLLTPDQVKKMFKELFGTKGMEHDATKAGLADLLRMGEHGFVGIHVFRPYCKTHQALLTPVFTMQQKLRNATLGVSLWESLSNRNIEVHVGRSMPIKELMVLHSDRKLFHSLLEDQTILRVSSMMRIVLDNTDNAQHGEALKPVEAPKQRNTYLLMPVENTIHGAGGANNGNGNLHSVANAKLNAHSHSQDEASTHNSHHSTHNSHHSQHSHHGHKHHKHSHDNEDSIHSNHSVHSTHSTSHNINTSIHPGGHATLSTTHIPHSLHNNGLHSANASHNNSSHSVSARNNHNNSMYNAGDKSTHHHTTTSGSGAAELSHRHTNGAQVSARVSSPPHMHGQRSAMRETHINHV